MAALDEKLLDDLVEEHVVSPYPRVASAFTIFACTVSGGLLSLPAAFSTITFGPAFMLAAFTSITTVLSLLNLSLVARLDDRVHGYGSLLGRIWGPVAERLMDFGVGLFLTGVLGGNMIVIHDYFLTLFETSLGVSSSWPPVAATLGVAVMLMGLGLPTNVGKLAYAAGLATAAFCFLVVTLVYYGVDEVAAGNSTGGEWWPTTDIASALSKSLPVILYAFGCQFQLIDIFLSLEGQRRQLRRQLHDRISEDNTIANLNGLSFVCRSMAESEADDERDPAAGSMAYFSPVAFSAVAAMFVLFAIVGVFGVLAFPGKDIQGDVITMLQGKGDLGNIASACVVCAVILASPLLVHPIKGCIAPVVPRKLRSNALMTVTIVGVATAIALSGLNFMEGVGVMGSFLCSPMFFVLPGSALLRLLHEEQGTVDVVRPADKLGSRAAVLGAHVMAWYLVAVGLATFVVSVREFLLSH